MTAWGPLMPPYLQLEALGFREMRRWLRNVWSQDMPGRSHLDINVRMGLIAVAGMAASNVLCWKTSKMLGFGLDNELGERI